MIRVYIIAPSVTVRAGLRALFLDDPQVDIIGEGVAPDDHLGPLEPDVVIWAPTTLLGYEFSIENITQDWIGIPTAWLVIHPDPMVIERLVKSNIHVWGILSPDASQSELVAAVRALSEGLTVINPTWVDYISNAHKITNGENASGLVEPLTGREMDVLQLVALGLTNKQIAVKLAISMHTVKFHVSSIYSKMGTSNRTETVKLGLKMGLILL